MLIGLIGTTTAPWMQFYMQSAVVEKGITAKDYPYSRADTIIGCIVTGLVASFIIIACAATIYKNHIPIETTKDAAIALGPLAGKYASGLFAFGLINASLFAACILPLSTSYTICQALGFESGVGRTFKEAPIFFSLYTFHLVIAAIVVLLPHAPLLQIMFLSQVANGVLLPFVLVIMLQLINNRGLMGQYKNSRGLNSIAWLTTVILIAITLVMLATQIGSFIRL
jgi:Mn2+/Fe2+ NRAMP family transporter